MTANTFTRSIAAPSSQSELEDVLSAMTRDGYAVVGGAYPPELVHAMHETYLARHSGASAETMREQAAASGGSEVLEVGKRRYEVSFPLQDSFAEAALRGSSLVQSVLQSLLGDGYVLSSFSVVVSYPGAAMQHIHRDYPHLFESAAISTLLPPHAISVAVPLIDVDLECGPTGFWAGSHRWQSDVRPDPDAATVHELNRGDCVLADYRTIHTGMPNTSDRVRPILYIVYTRPWFFDQKNFLTRKPIEVPAEAYERMTPEMQGRLARVRAAEIWRKPAGQ